MHAPDFPYRTSLKLPDLDMLEIVYETIRNSDFGVKALVNLAPAFWKLLVQSFFELRYVFSLSHS